MRRADLNMDTQMRKHGEAFIHRKFLTQSLSHTYFLKGKSASASSWRVDTSPTCCLHQCFHHHDPLAQFVFFWKFSPGRTNTKRCGKPMGKPSKINDLHVWWVFHHFYVTERCSVGIHRCSVFFSRGHFLEAHFLFCWPTKNAHTYKETRNGSVWKVFPSISAADF